MASTVLSIQTGRIAPLGPNAVPSAFAKSCVKGRVAVGQLGLECDEQADPIAHGGPDKAVYGYSAEHYGVWASDYPEHSAAFRGGGFGENLTIFGLTEADLCVGDVHGIGSARLQVCQPRQPCFKLALYFDDNRLPKAMVRNGRAGWYYRVLEEGVITAGDAVTLVERPNPEFAFDRLVEIVNFRSASGAEIAAMATISGIADWLRDAARSRDRKFAA
ncbi:MAG: MOSC domain-containing protein [Sphingomicrobium sp.]